MKVLTKLYLSLILILILLAPGIYSQDKNHSDCDNNYTANRFYSDAHDLYFAQLDESPSDMTLPPNDKEVKQSRRKHLEQLRILKLLELLDLSEDQDIEFIRVYRKHRKEIKKNEREHYGIVVRLSEGLKKNNISENDIILLTTDILSNNEERFNLNNSFLIESKEILSAKQYGKLVVFQERFERELLEQVRQFRNQERFGPGQGRRGMGNEKQKTFDLN